MDTGPFCQLDILEIIKIFQTSEERYASSQGLSGARQVVLLNWTELFLTYRCHYYGNIRNEWTTAGEVGKIETDLGNFFFFSLDQKWTSGLSSSYLYCRSEQAGFLLVILFTAELNKQALFLLFLLLLLLSIYLLTPDEDCLSKALVFNCSLYIVV